MSAGDNFVGDIFMLVEDDIMLKFTRAQGAVHNLHKGCCTKLVTGPKTSMLCYYCYDTAVKKILSLILVIILENLLDWIKVVDF